MNVRLDPQSERLIEQQLRAGRSNSPEEVVARALEALAQHEVSASEGERRRQAVQDMSEFADKHNFTLGDDLRLRDLIHEEHKR